VSLEQTLKLSLILYDELLVLHPRMCVLARRELILSFICEHGSLSISSGHLSSTYIPRTQPEGCER
jgi:hypothetical protein